eukprot:TRINITY_DN3744_c0_g1_i2.p1 TRINITY_DN3744_c0_g1~~TRINITY_DN3744_c0_g1_i2.p1  ORF type:complete len:994 (+),score=321.27 TRINITY_DN3744_c0_g1_i2:104-2983(+)
MVLSTGSSIAGGLVMYFQGLEALEDTVRDSSASEVSGMHGKLEVQMSKVTDSAQTLKHFLYSHERIKGRDSAEWSALVRTLSFAQLASSDVLYSSSVFVHPHSVTNRSVFYSGSWGDVLADGSRDIVFGVYGDFMPAEMFVAGDGVIENMTMHAYGLDSGTGYIRELSYTWQGASDFMVLGNLNITDLAVRDMPLKAHVPGSRVALWSDALVWVSRDMNPYAYTQLDMVYDPPPAPHPWSTFKFVQMRVGFLFKSFQPPFDEYRTEHPDTTLLLVERSTGVVYASTEGGMIPDWCQPTTRGGGDLLTLSCALNVGNLSQAVQEGFQSLAGMAYGEFKSTKVGGKQYFLRRELSVRGLELVWMRPASSVDGKVQEALMYLVIFTTIVLVFDLAISIAEVTFIALPMKRLAVAVNAVSIMETDAAASVLDLLRSSPVYEVSVMHAAITRLVENVTTYKTFLPQAILAETTGETTRTREAPGLNGDDIAIVFTDIVGSTLLWEACPTGMSTALRMHNEVVRWCIAEYNGYEVKTIGDAFMVAFDTADEAVLFGLAVQDQLTKAAWPEDLLREPLCARDDSGDWVGIRVRIGVTYGPVTAEANTVSKRCDYFGPTVNRAARLESVCVGGAVAVEDTLEATLAPTTSSGAIVTQVGPRTLKGISQAVSVSMLVPKTLPKRAHCVMRESSRRTQRPDEELSNSLATETHSTRHALSLRVADKLSRIGLATTGQLTQMLTSIPSDNMSAELNQLVTSTMVALERTDGTMLSLAGGCAVIGWNTSKACHSHVENAFRFAGMMVRALGDNVRCGLSTGPMHSGYVGSQGQRFMTAVGVSSTQAGAAMVYAEPLGVHFAYTSNDTATLDAMCEQLYLRPVDTCTIGRSRVVIHEINRHKVEEWCDDKLVPLLSLRDESLRDDTLEVRGCWGTAYCKAYHGRDLTRLEEMAVRDPDISAVLRRLRLEGLA